ncbi:MAG: TldD/PmbA family protein [Halobacteria archaeon]
MDPDRIQALLRRAIARGARYADARFQRIASTRLLWRGGEAREVGSGTETGLCVRVLGRTWGFASGAPADAAKLAERAARLARGGLRPRLAPRLPAPLSHRWLAPSRRPPATVPLEEKVALVKRTAKAARVPGVRSATVTYTDLEEERWFLGPETELRASVPRVLLGVRAVAREGARVQEASERHGAAGGFEIAEAGSARADRAGKKARDLLKAKPAPGGKMAVVMDGDLAGVFAHEAVGHAAEADHLLLGETILEGHLGKRIGSPAFTLRDEPALAGAFGYTPFDDEGVPGGSTTVVETGRLRGFLHSRETAAHLRAAPTGNGRAEGFEDVPVVRMTNLVIPPGDRTGEELLDVRRGIYARKMHGGQVDTVTGTFQFSAEEAFLIRNGELGPRLRNVSLSGSTLRTLRGVEARGKEREASIGWCGKMGQSVPVSELCPALRISEILVG